MGVRLAMELTGEDWGSGAGDPLKGEMSRGDPEPGDSLSKGRGDQDGESGEPAREEVLDCGGRIGELISASTIVNLRMEEVEEVERVELNGNSIFFSESNYEKHKEN